MGAAYGSYTRIWNIFAEMEAEDFEHFSNSHSLTSFVLQAHFLALEVLVRPWLDVETPNRRSSNRLLRNLLQAFAASTHGYDDKMSHALVAWPRQLLEEDPSR